MKKILDIVGRFVIRVIMEIVTTVLALCVIWLVVKWLFMQP